MDLSRILVVADTWYPQGGGAELATSLYVRRALEDGHRVTIASNSRMRPLESEKMAQIVHLPLSAVPSKPEILLKTVIVAQKVSEIAKSHDVLYTTGRLMPIIPLVRKSNPSLKVIMHLHDYQLICPQSTLFNFTNHGMCKHVWSSSACSECCMRFEVVNSHGGVRSVVSLLSTSQWKRAVDVERQLESVDTFLTVSRAQAELIAKLLERSAQTFWRKNKTLYNPVDPTIQYVPPHFDSARLAFLGGESYLKGIQEVLSLMKRTEMQDVGLLATKMSTNLSTGRFEFLPRQDRKQILELFQRVWILLLMSKSPEPLPYVTVEAQLMGRPVVASAVGGAFETIAKPGYTGDVAEVGTSEFEEKIHAYLRNLADSPNKYTSEISATSRSFFEDRTRHSYNQFLGLLD